jgi:hypothetical protein
MAGEPQTVSKHSQSRSSPAPLLHLVALGLGAVATGIVWFYLVGAAIDFGALAVAEGGPAWLFTLEAGIGAVVAMVLMLALVGRVLRALGVISDYKPRRAGARRRR